MTTPTSQAHLVREASRKVLKVLGILLVLRRRNAAEEHVLTGPSLQLVQRWGRVARLDGLGLERGGTASRRCSDRPGNGTLGIEPSLELARVLGVALDLEGGKAAPVKRVGREFLCLFCSRRALDATHATVVREKDDVSRVAGHVGNICSTQLGQSVEVFAPRLQRVRDASCLVTGVLLSVSQALEYFPTDFFRILVWFDPDAEQLSRIADPSLGHLETQHRELGKQGERGMEAKACLVCRNRRDLYYDCIALSRRSAQRRPLERTLPPVFYRGGERKQF